jgi:2-haloalkanoic acid dehalogenase type II
MLTSRKDTVIVFDMYRTLVANNEDLWKGTFAKICESQGLAVELDRFGQVWKNEEQKFRRGRVDLEDPKKSPPFKSYFEAWCEAFRDCFEALGLDGNPESASIQCVEDMAKRPLFPDVVPALERLRERGVGMAVLSNADDASLYPLVKRLELKFDAVLSSETAGVYKPHPDAFWQILEMLKIKPSQAIYAGDNLLDDMHGAKLVGMHTAWINRNYAKRQVGLLPPDQEFPSLEQMIV